MVYEFAVEPTLLNRWDQFRYLVEKFDVSQGRLISRFPEKWKRMVYESLAECKDVEKARIEEGLRRIDHRLLTTTRAYNDGGPSWLENAEASHLQMLEALAGAPLLRRSYRQALAEGYLWHEFGDSHLILT